MSSPGVPPPKIPNNNSDPTVKMKEGGININFNQETEHILHHTIELGINILRFILILLIIFIIGISQSASFRNLIMKLVE